jgi:hypothetical protein
MPNTTILKEKLRLTAVQPIDLFNRFYALFGFVITISGFSACFTNLHSPSFPGLFGMAIGVVPAWGLVYGAWVARQTWTWCLLTTISIVSLIVLGFHLTGQPDLMFTAFGAAEGVCLCWLLLTGIKLCNLKNQ